MKRGFSEDFQPDTPTAAAKRRRGTRRTDSSGSGLKKVWYTTANVMEPFDEHVPLFTPLTVIVWIRSALKKRGVSLPQEWVTLGEMLPRHCFEGFRNVTPKTRPIKFAWEHVMAMTRSDVCPFSWCSVSHPSFCCVHLHSRCDCDPAPVTECTKATNIREGKI
jgi:hypothetical protein